MSQKPSLPQSPRTVQLVLTGNTREILDAGGIKGLDDEMIAQAAQVRFFYDPQWRVAIEPRKAAAKRGISSPARWESVVLAFGVEPYDSLAESLDFMKRLRGVADGQPPPYDGGRRYTNRGLFSGRKGGY